MQATKPPLAIRPPYPRCYIGTYYARILHDRP